MVRIKKKPYRRNRNERFPKKNENNVSGGGDNEALEDLFETEETPEMVYQYSKMRLMMLNTEIFVITFLSLFFRSVVHLCR